jgi:hypothetical protein
LLLCACNLHPRLHFVWKLDYLNYLSIWLHCVFCAFGCGLLFELRSFLFSSLVPLLGGFFFFSFFFIFLLFLFLFIFYLFGYGYITKGNTTSQWRKSFWSIIMFEKWGVPELIGKHLPEVELWGPYFENAPIRGLT